MAFIYALISITLVSLLSLIGAIFIITRRKLVDSFTTYLLAISSGILLGTTFYDLIPEGFSQIGADVYTCVIAGLVTFFVLEKFIHWHSHMEEGESTKKPLAYLTLVGDGIHNFLDGVMIGVTFLASIPLGFTTTIAVIAHEIPHELGDFFLLTYGGLSNKKALGYNFLSALTALLGVIVVFIFSHAIDTYIPYLIGFAAGNFLYIATSNLIPELHEKRNINISIVQTLLLVSGVLLMGIISSRLEG